MLFADLKDTPLWPLVCVFTTQGLSFEFCAQTFLEYILPLSADVFFQIEVELELPPFCMKNWFEPGISEDQLKDRIAKCYQLPYCCCDPGIIRKVPLMLLEVTTSFFCYGWRAH